MTSSEESRDVRHYFYLGIKAGRLAHAHLIVGPTSIALDLVGDILGMLFCSEKGENPCRKCENCRRLAANRHPDVLWIRPSGNAHAIKIEQIRQISSVLSRKAFAGPWKCAVILDAHRMTIQAANAFLKTLEEPLGTAVLFLLTENPDALPETIRSRCQKTFLSHEDPNDVVIRSSIVKMVHTLLSQLDGSPIGVAKSVEELCAALDAIEDAQAPLDKSEKDGLSSDECHSTVEVILMAAMQYYRKVLSDPSAVPLTIRDILTGLRALECAQALLERNANKQLVLEEWLFATSQLNACDG